MSESVTNDSVQIGAGASSGAIIATEYIAAELRHYQIVKLAHGGNDKKTYVASGLEADGTGGAPLPVQIYTDRVGTASAWRKIGPAGATEAALNVNILGNAGLSGSNNTPLPVMSIGPSGNTGSVGVTGEVSMQVWNGAESITSGSGLAYYGITGGDTVLIRNLTGGTIGHTGATANDRDYVVVQGVSAGYPVRSTLWNQLGTTAAGISGSGATGSLLSYITNEVGVTFGVAGITVDMVSGTGLRVTAGAAGANWGITLPATGMWVKSTGLTISQLTGGTVGYDGATGIGRDFVVVQGVCAGYPVSSRIYAGSGMTFTPVGVSGDALNVNILDAGITVDVNVTDTSFMIHGRGNTFEEVVIKGSTNDGATLMPVHIQGTTLGWPVGITFDTGVGSSGLLVKQFGTTWGVTFGVATVQSTDLDIRSLSGGSLGSTNATIGDKDFVIIQGISQGYPVRSTLWNQLGTTAAGISGSGATGSLLSYITNEVGVTFGVAGITVADLEGLLVKQSGRTWGVSCDAAWNTRNLTGGTGSLLSHEEATLFAGFDSVIVQGASLGYPVGSRLYAGTGATIAPIGMSGTALNVNILDAGITVNVDVTDTSFMIQGMTAGGVYTGVPVRIEGQTGGAVQIGGVEGATAVAVTAGAEGFKWGITAGAAINVQATNEDWFKIRGLTYGIGNTSDWVGVTGDLYTRIAGMSAEMDRQGNTFAAMIPIDARDTAELGLARQFELATIGATLEKWNTSAVNLGATLSHLTDCLTGVPAPFGPASKKLVVRVEETKQPEEFWNGQLATSTAAARIDGGVTARTLKSGINIKAHQQNNGKIFVGNNTVTTETGYPLVAGEELFIEIESTVGVYVIADITGLTSCYIGM